VVSKEAEVLRQSRCIHFAVALLVAVMTDYAVPSAQAPAYSQDQQRAMQILNALAKAFPAGDSARDIRWLVESVNSRPAASLPATVLDGLEASFNALNRITELPDVQRKALVETVRADLQLKAAYCRTHSEGMAGQVALNVRTLLAAPARSEATQWQVLYINAPLAGFPGRKPAPFPRFSSPTSMFLPPGAYVIWAQDPLNASRRGPETLVRLGVAGAQTLDADVLVAPGP
jgi:hypothetical protein